jgi:hypothetical protein
MLASSLCLEILEQLPLLQELRHLFSLLPSVIPPDSPQFLQYLQEAMGSALTNQVN